MPLAGGPSALLARARGEALGGACFIGLHVLLGVASVENV